MFLKVVLVTCSQIVRMPFGIRNTQYSITLSVQYNIHDTKSCELAHYVKEVNVYVYLDLCNVCVKDIGR